MNFMATLCERMGMETYNTIFTIAFLIIFAPQDVTPEIILLLLCHFKVISNTKKKKKKALCGYKVDFTEAYGGCLIFFLFMQSMFPLVREGLQSIRLLRAAL